MIDKTIPSWSIEKGWHTAVYANVDACSPELAGFLRVFEFGQGYSHFLHVYVHEDGHFLAVIGGTSDGGRFQVLIPDLGCALEFIRLYSPALQQTRLMELIEETYDLLFHEDYGLLRDLVLTKAKYEIEFNEAMRRRFNLASDCEQPN